MKKTDRKKTNIVVGTAVVVGVVSILYVFAFSRDSDVVQSLSSSAVNAPTTDKIVDVVPPLPSTPKISEPAAVSVNDHAPGVINMPAWAELPEIPPQYQEMDIGHSVDRRFVHYSDNAVQGLAVGDEFDIYIPQLGTTYTSNVGHVEQHTNGSKTIVSHYYGDDGQKYSVTFTQGEDALYATIGTPDDMYFMQGNANEGWIISGRDQDSLRTWENDDAILPPVDSTITPPEHKKNK